MTKNRKRKIYEKMKSNVDKFGPIKAYNRCNSLLPKSTLIKYVEHVANELVNSDDFINRCDKILLATQMKTPPGCLAKIDFYCNKRTLKSKFEYWAKCWFREKNKNINKYVAQKFKHLWFSYYLSTIFFVIVDKAIDKYCATNLEMKIKQIKIKYRLADLENDFI